MRNEFIQTLVTLAQADERIVLLTADLGYTVVEPFAEKFPERFFNVGVSEQNMVGIATGLAEADFIPFIYSIVNFAVMRPYEFIRNGPILHQLPVRIVGVGGGFEYGCAGITHFGLEDIGLMRLQKGITTIVPADAKQVQAALQKTWDLPGPIYYRIAKGDKNFNLNINQPFQVGRAYTIQEGQDILFITLGSMTKEVLRAAKILSSQGISSSVVIVPSFNPSPDDDIKKALEKFKLVLTVEDHFVNGGLGSYVAEIATSFNLSCQILRLGINALYDGKIGSRDFMLKKHGLSSEKLAQYALKNLQSVQCKI